MPITCAVSSDCTELAVGVCESCCKPFCESHASPKYKHLCQEHSELNEPGALRALRETSYWSARRIARDKNTNDLCGVDWCQHKAAVKCVSCHQSYCEPHVTEVTYLQGRHAGVHAAKGLLDARTGHICESCRHNHVDITLVDLA
jgi:hypothetical protein